MCQLAPHGPHPSHCRIHQTDTATSATNLLEVKNVHLAKGYASIWNNLRNNKVTCGEDMCKRLLN